MRIAEKHQTLKATAVAFLLALCLAFGVACGAGEDQRDSYSAIDDAPATLVDIDPLMFRSQTKLQQHFEKHGWETGSSTPEEYLANANAVIANPDALYKTESEDGDDVYFLEDTGEIVIVSTDGYIRTYYLADKAYFDRQ